MSTTESPTLKRLWARTFEDGRTNTFSKEREVTSSIIENFPERLPRATPSEHDFAWMDVTFAYVDNAPVDRYFNHTPEADYVRAHGGANEIQDARELLVAFTAIDKDGNLFDRFVAAKNDPAYVDAVLKLKKGDKLRLGGRISKAGASVRWFNVDSIDQY